MLTFSVCAQFKEHYVKRGIDGGRKAAQALKAAILKQCHGLATEIEVIAKVCVNLAGLAQAMQRDGSLDNESQLKDFAVGFTRAVASFDFIDVGSGSADVKIQGRQQRDSIYRRNEFTYIDILVLQRPPRGT